MEPEQPAAAPPSSPRPSPPDAAPGPAPTHAPAPTPTPTPTPAPTPAPGPAAEDSAPAGKSERRPRDMALSLVVLLVPIALLLTFYRVVLDGDEPISVDLRPAVADARAAKAFPVLEPTGLPAEWKAVSVTFRRVDGGATLRIGYVDPAGDPVQLVQSSVPVQTLLPAELGAGATPSGAVTVGTADWQRYDTTRDELALIRLEPGRTVILVGTSGSEHLAEIAAALR